MRRKQENATLCKVISLSGLLAVLASGQATETARPVKVEANPDTVESSLTNPPDMTLDKDTQRALDLGEFKIPTWLHSFELRGGLGYKDNVLLSPTNVQGSAFWGSGVEAMIFRLPTHGWQFSLFADATDVRYFDAPSVDNEQVAIAATQLSKDLGRDWKSTVGLTYMFQNQVFDASATYTNEESVGLILGHTLVPRWSVRKKLGQFWVEAELKGTRQWVESPLDDYWETGARVAAGYTWGHGSEATLAYQWGNLRFDTREPVDSLGAPIPGASLQLESNEAEAALTCVWDEKRRWQTVTSLGFEAYRDNGSGFYDYSVYRASQQLRYRHEKWEIFCRVGIGQYDYTEQTVSTEDASLRRRTMWGALLRIERKLSKHLKVQAAYYWDQSISNLDFDNYRANVVTAGVSVTF